MEIVNKRAALHKKNGEGHVLYSEWIRGCLDAVPASMALPVSEIRKRSKILDKLEEKKFKEGDKMVFSEEEGTIIKQCVKITGWTMVDKAIIQFCDDIEKA